MFASFSENFPIFFNVHFNSKIWFFFKGTKSKINKNFINISKKKILEYG